MLTQLKHLYHFLLALFGAILYRFPSRRIFVIGVTGTKGKTSVVELLSHILEIAGYRTAFISSVHVKIADDIQKNMTGNTMPGRFFIQQFLESAVETKCKFALLEVTSQGVAQSRHRFVDFNAAIFTNLEPEHIESHGSFEKYRDAKLAFFRAVSRSPKPQKYFLINRDDEGASHFEKAAESGRVVLFSGEEIAARYFPLATHAANIAAAVTMAGELGIPEEKIRSALKGWQGVRGRMEVVQEQPFRVVIDYAHTPNSLRYIYENVKPRSGKLICVLGAAGGGRDKWKRAKFGEIAGRYCDEIFLANEDPYDEYPVEILEQIATGIPAEKTVHIIGDRREAIREALETAKEGDAVALTGKGSESYIHMAKGEKIPWDERGVVAQCLGKRKGGH